MAQCVATVMVNGVAVLTPVDAAPCTTLVVVTPAEYEVMSSSPFNLSLTDGALIATAILGVWGIGYCWRSIRDFAGGFNSED